MKIYVFSRGLREGYEWVPDMPQELDKTQQVQPSEEAGALSLTACYLMGKWSIAFHNLFLPEKKDIRNREIVLHVCFADLTSESDVRALALAYLDFETRNVNADDNPFGTKYNQELAEAYSGNKESFFDYDVDRVKKWAERAISKYNLEYQTPDSRLNVRIHPGRPEDLEKVRNHIRQYSLREEEGIRLLWRPRFDSPYKDEQKRADMQLQCSPDVISWEVVRDSAPKSQRPSQGGELTPVQIKAREMEDEAKKPVGDAPSGMPLDPLKKYIAGCVILLVIVGIVFILQGRQSSTTSLDVFSSHTCQMKVHGKTYEISAHVPREILLPDSLDGMIILEIQNEPSECILLLNGKRINKGADGKYSLPKQGGTLQILQPKS